MINFLKEINQTQNFLATAWRGVCIMVDTALAKTVSFLYSIFYYTATAKIRDEAFFSQIIENVGKIIGILVLFSVAISFIQYVVNPDKFNDTKIGAGKLVTRILISIALLANITRIFDMAFMLQEKIINNSVIEKILLSGKSQYEAESSDSGTKIAGDILFTFIKKNDLAGDPPSPALSITDLKTFISGKYNNYNLDESLKYLSFLRRDINLSNEFNREYYYEYTTVIPTIVMCFFSWIFIVYTFSVGIRVVQLFFLQVIAPLPIMMYVLPNGEEKLKNWVKQCTITYFDLFIRIFIINFALVLIKRLPEIEIDAKSLELKEWVTIAIMLAILMFAKKAPELIKELFPGKSAASGDFGLSLKNRFKDNMAGGLVGAVVGAGLAGVGTMAGNAISAVQNGKGKWAGLTGKDKAKLIGKGVMSTLGGGISGLLRGMYKGGKGGTKDMLKNAEGAMTAASAARNARSFGYGTIAKATDRFTDAAKLSKNMGTTSEIKNRIKQNNAMIAEYNDRKESIYEGMHESIAKSDNSINLNKALERSVSINNGKMEYAYKYGNGENYESYYSALQNEWLMKEHKLSIDEFKALDETERIKYETDFAHSGNYASEVEYNTILAQQRYADSQADEIRKLEKENKKLEENTYGSKKG